MADIFLVEDRTTAVELFDSGDTYVLAEGVTHEISEAGNLLRLHGWEDQTAYSVVVSGTMTSLGAGNVIESIEYDVSQVSITVSATGRITAAENWRAISMQSTYVTVSNKGEITAAEAVRLSGDHAVLNNSGTLTCTYVGYSTVFTVILGGANARLTNSGHIVGDNGLRLSKDAQIINSGTILADDIAISSSTRDTGNAISLTNSGTIDGGAYAFVSGFSSDTLVNTGTMLGRITTGVGDDRVVNKGTLTGDMRLENGNDTLINEGQIDGNVRMGLNDDTYRGRADGVVVGQILGESGNDNLRGSRRDDAFNGGRDDDTLRGGSGNDTLEGETGLDRIVGGGGDDSLSGGDDADKIFGNSGSDTLDGGAGEDALRSGSGADVLAGGADDDDLRAGSGNDVLDGGTGADRLLGHSGDDTLVGGAGADTLIGGGDADTFVYTKTTDSALGAADQISDFKTGHDVLDMTDLIDGTFLYVGEAAHSGAGTRTIRDVDTSAGRSVFVDTDGDGVSDMEIVMKGVATLSAADFLL